MFYCFIHFTTLGFIILLFCIAIKDDSTSLYNLKVNEAFMDDSSEFFFIDLWKNMLLLFFSCH